MSFRLYQEVNGERAAQVRIWLNSAFTVPLLGTGLAYPLSNTATFTDSKKSLVRCICLAIRRRMGLEEIQLREVLWTEQVAQTINMAWSFFGVATLFDW